MAKRPLAIRFGPVEGKMPKKCPQAMGGVAFSKKPLADDAPLEWVDVTFNSGPLGVKLVGMPSGATNVVDLLPVPGLVRRRGDVVRAGMCVYKLNNTELKGVPLNKVLNALEKTPSPRLVTFRDLQLHGQIEQAMAEQQAAAGTEAK